MSEQQSDNAPRHPREVRCKSCHARIVFLPTKGGVNMPIDAASVAPDDEAYAHGRHVSHFSTCTRAAFHRRKRAAP